MVKFMFRKVVCRCVRTKLPFFLIFNNRIFYLLLNLSGVYTMVLLMGKPIAKVVLRFLFGGQGNWYRDGYTNLMIPVS